MPESHTSHIILNITKMDTAQLVTRTLYAFGVTLTSEYLTRADLSSTIEY